ncbi:MAG: ABC transporter six-transmembrane domain-containing protein [Chitinophagaceae bacterium]|jgi:ABC-type multidrug transport system fused ATPase/permease subunit|nr:ABC transporter six-transmembrane domain-containing protein [Chitinophagaceae bacterium]
MPGKWVIQTIVKQHRYKLLLTYSLFAVEMLGLLLRPYFLGEAVNDLLKNSYQGLILLVAAHLLWVITGTIRHMYDSRTYSDIYTSLVVRLMSRNKNKDLSKLSAHSNLSREFIDFLEFDFNYIIEAAYNIVGSLILLCFYDAQVVLLCLTMLIPVTVTSYIYGKRMRRLNKLRNDELEEQVNVLATKNTIRINQHYNNLRKWQIRISDQEAWNFGVMELLVIVIISASLIISSKMSGKTLQAGDLIGIYTYILKFVSGLDTVPYMIQRIASLKDILHRVELQTDDEKEVDPEPVFSSVA